MLAFSTRAAVAAALSAVTALCALLLINTPTVHASDTRPSFYGRSTSDVPKVKRPLGDKEGSGLVHASSSKAFPRKHPHGSEPITQCRAAAASPVATDMPANRNIRRTYSLMYSLSEKVRFIELDPCWKRAEVLHYISTDRRWSKLGIDENAGLGRLNPDMTVREKQPLPIQENQTLEMFFRDLKPDAQHVLYVTPPVLVN